MGDQQGGAAGSVPADAGEDALLGFGVHAGEAVVQGQHGRLSDQPPGQRRPLLLAAGQGDAPLTHDGVQPFREAGNGVLEVRRGGGGPDALQGTIRVIVGQVGLERLAEQKGVLRHQGHLRPQLRQWIGAHIQAVDAQQAWRRLQQPHQQLQQGGLAGTHPPHDGHHFAALDAQPHFVQGQGALWGIAVA